MELVSTVEVRDQWVIQCAWASWKASDAQTSRCDLAVRMRSHIQSSAVSTLACGLSNGDVVLVDVAETLLLAPPGSFSVEVETVIRNEKAAIPDKRIITTMKWISRQDGVVSDIVLRA